MTSEHIAKVLAKIHSEVPVMWRQKVTKEVRAYKNISFVVDKALQDPNFPEEKKKALQVLKDAGEFEKTMVVEDPIWATKIDNFIGRRINEEIRKGNLPPKSKLREFLPSKSNNEESNTKKG